jgi:hypothetical protein
MVERCSTWLPAAIPEELAAEGLHLNHEERYEASAEFTHVWRKVLEGETVDFDGKHIQVKGAKLLYPPVQQPRPPLYFGGSSAAAQDLAAEQVEMYLTWGEPPAQVKEKIAEVRAKAAAKGRKVRFGIRLHVIVRETTEEAWKAADRLIANLDEKTIADAQKAFARFDSVGPATHGRAARRQKRQPRSQPQPVGRGGLVRGGAGTALVGDGPTVAARVKEYADLGIDTFILPATRIWKSRIASANCCSRTLTWSTKSRRCRKAPVQEPVWREWWPTTIFPKSVAELRSPLMAKGTQRILHRLAPWALPVALVVIWQISVEAGWLSTVFCRRRARSSPPSGR